MKPEFSQWIVAFAITCLVELPYYALWLRGRVTPFWKVFVIAFALQVSTHPALWYVFPQFEPRWAYVLVAELCVWTVEAGLLLAVLRSKPTFWRAAGIAMAASLTANAASTVVGLLKFS